VSAISAGRPGSSSGSGSGSDDGSRDGSREPADLFVDTHTAPLDLFVDTPRTAPAASGDPARSARRAAPRRRHALAALAVAAVVVAVCAAAVGFLLTSGGPLSVIGLNASPAPAPVAGTAGLSPGGAPVEVGFIAVGTATSGSVTVTAVEPDADSLPLDCPPAAWVVTVPQPVTIAVATVPTRVPARVTLSDDAPTECQGLTVQALTGTVVGRPADGKPTRLLSTADRSLRVATLGTPGIAVTRDSGAPVVVITPDAAAPAGTHYSVESAGPDGAWHSACRLTGPTPCATGDQAEAGTTRYRVTARLGSFWQRASTVLQA
jgi:hypothetical protein